MHVGLELAGGRSNALRLEQLGDLLVKRIGFLGRAGLIETGAPPLAAIPA